LVNRSLKSGREFKLNNFTYLEEPTMRRIKFGFIGSGFAAILVIGLLAGVAFAQDSTSGTINGSVVDQQDAVVAGATVTIRNKETGEEKTATTTESGAFVIAHVRPGLYTLTVEAKGFKRVNVPTVTVNVGQVAALSVTLETGEVTEQVTVTGGVQEVINTSSPSLSNVVDTRQVRDLPLGGRNPVELAGLQAGIAVIGTDVRGASVAGLRQTAVNLTQDGINSMDNFVKTSSFFAITTPSLNSTAEFSITTGTVSSEQGRGGAQVNLVTKGGTNDYHGGVFYQFLNESLNANTFFNNFNGLPRPVLRQKFYGGDIGGPVHFFKPDGNGGLEHWNGKDTAFFFFSFEAFRQSQSRANNRVVLSQNARNGVFSYRDNTNTTQTVNLLTTSSRGFGLNPIMTAHLNLIPLPNNSNCGSSDGFNILCYTFNATESNSNNKYVLRYDHHLVKNSRLGSHKLEFVYSRVVTRTFPDVFTNGLDAPFPGGVNGFQASTRNLITPALVSELGPKVTNVLRIGRQWAPVDFNRDSMPTTPFFILPGALTNYDNTFMPQPRETIVNQVTNTTSWVNGDHLWKFGADWQNVFGQSFNDAGINQTITFGTNAANPVGFAVANFPGITANAAGNAIVANATTVYAMITGLLASSAQTLNVQTPTSGFVPGYTRFRTVGGRDLSLFMQDQWRMKSNFTLNYGVRWDFMGVPTVPNGLAIQPTNPDHIWGVSGVGNQFRPTAAPGSQVNPVATLDFVSGDTGKGLYRNDWDNFAPFVGFAWSPEFNSGPLHFIFGDGGKSAIRAGYSISYLHDGITTFTNLLGVGTTNPGLIATANLDATTGSANLLGVIGAGGVQLRQPPFLIPITDRQNFLANFNNGLWTADPNLRSAYVHQWNFGIEREIFKNTALEIRYQGNFVPNGWRAWDVNEVNIFENGFLQEFLRAQSNLAICVTNSAACQAAQAAAGVPAASRTANNFANWGLAGQVNLPIMAAFFNGLTNFSTSGFASSGFVSNLNNNNIGTMANVLAYNSAYRAARENPANGIPANFFVANPNAGFSRILLNGAKSNYHAMEIEIRRRFSGGLQFQFDYTWSKAMVDGDAQGNNQSDLAQPLTFRDLSLDHRRSSQDQTQRFVGNVIYDLPFGRGHKFLSNANGIVDRLVRGWTMGSIVTWSTGVPWYVTSGRSTFNCAAPLVSGACPTPNQGAQLVGITLEEFRNNLGVFKTPAGVFFINPNLLDITVNPNTGKVATARLKPGLMAAPAPGTIGNFPVNSLDGPGYFNLDFSVTKRFPITDDGRVSFEIKATAINVLNYSNFVYGNTNFDSTTFGLITTQRGNVRTMNFIGQLRF
jgi:hypothetical protein